MKCGLSEQQDVFKVTLISKNLWVIKLGESTCFDAWNMRVLSHLLATLVKQVCGAQIFDDIDVPAVSLLIFSWEKRSVWIFGHLGLPLISLFPVEIGHGKSIYIFGRTRQQDIYFRVDVGRSSPVLATDKNAQTKSTSP